MILGTSEVNLCKSYLYCKMENIWHKVQNCKRCGAKKTVKKCQWGHPTKEAYDSGEWVIMGCCMQPITSRWACTKCEWKYYHPEDIPGYMFIEEEIF